MKFGMMVSDMAHTDMAEQIVYFQTHKCIISWIQGHAHVRYEWIWMKCFWDMCFGWMDGQTNRTDSNILTWWPGPGGDNNVLHTCFYVDVKTSSQSSTAPSLRALWTVFLFFSLYSKPQILVPWGHRSVMRSQVSLTHTNGSNFLTK